MAIKIGVIGAGFIGPVHVEAVRRLGDVEVIAISASSQAHADAKAHALGGASQALGDIGSHWCDLAQFVSGLRITALCADTNAFITSRQRPKGEIETFAASATGETEFMRVSGEDYATVLLQFENGARGSFLISQVSGGHKNDLALEVNGTLASLGWQQEQPERLWVGQRDAANAVLLKQPNLLTERARKFAHYPGGHIEGYPDGFKNLVARFYAFIREGRDPQ